MAQNRPHADHPSRILGIITFVIGIALLFSVFLLAHQLFSSPLPGLGLPVKPGMSPPPAANIGLALTAFLKQVILMFLMTIVGSVMANKGIHLYFAALQFRSGGDAANAPDKKDG